MKIICGRFALYHIDDGTEFFGVYNPLVSFNPSYNIGPQSPVPVITGAVRSMAWGMAIWGITRRGESSLQINVRAETLAAEGFYGDTRRRRCLIPANGYYEWTKVGHLKVPFYFSLRDRPLFAFAGTMDRAGEHCAIVTTSAPGAANEICDRIPAILSRSEYRSWLS